MSRLRWATVELDAPADLAWSTLVDTRRWPEWGPSVARVELDPDTVADPAQPHRIGAGTVGHVRTAVGVRLAFRVTRFTAGRDWRWSVAGIPATDHRVEPLDEQRCRVGIGVPVAASPYLVVCRVALGRIRSLAEAGTGPGDPPVSSW